MTAAADVAPAGFLADALVAQNVFFALIAVVITTSSVLAHSGTP